ncbi:hypothetical protein JAAARDRAFT_138539 [Jaapia argillacea MUCL 33604]|uniref:DUF2470 domain-containing protein n=1 Tax=Jaapia argillacea MUCL 33604 TaxID=933084 RepID=A0A067PCN0_9AGAM|nr:hypothetical protein JAAARDRAFT_138539 [Jaapia argillacea MUCL 33604]
MSSLDPVASKSGFLCMYMSNHPDALVSYVKHYGKVSGNVTSAKMSKIDSNAMTLSYTTSSAKGKSKDNELTVTVPFDPPLAGYEEVKPRLLAMKVDAEEALGMSKSPTLTSFTFPPTAYQTFSAVLSLVYVTFAPPPSPTDSPALSTLLTPASLLREAVGGTQVIKWIWVFMFGVHALESVYTWSLCKKYKLGFGAGSLYVIGTIFLGYPFFTHLRKRAQDARIESILKGN